MIERLRVLPVKNCRRAALPGCLAVSAPPLNSNPQRTSWRFEQRRLAACSSLRSPLPAAPAAVERLFWSSASTLAPNVLSSFPYCIRGHVVTQIDPSLICAMLHAPFHCPFSSTLP